MDYTKFGVQRQLLYRYAAVAQLDRVPDSDSGGRGFESRQPYHEKPSDDETIRRFFVYMPIARCYDFIAL